MPTRLLPLPQSERKALRLARVSGPADPAEVARVTVVLRPRSPERELELVRKLSSVRPRDRTYLSRLEFEREFGSAGEELVKVRDFAAENSLSVVEESAAKRSVVLSGTVGHLSKAFNVTLARYEHPARGSYRGRVGPVFVSEELVSVVAAVLGLDNRPQARTHFRMRPQAEAGVSYAPTEVARLYDYPSLDGSGQSFGILELGGGYSRADILSFFSGLGIAPPSVTAVSVDGATNSPTGDPAGPDAEVSLDIEVAGAIAPNADVLVYFAPNTDAGFVDGVGAALHGAQGEPSVLSISWGSAEDEWTAQGIGALDQAFQDAAVLGVTVCAASGDNGSSDGVDDGLAHVDYPASSQYVVGCGGTRLTASGGRISSQVAWDDLPSGGATGGGVSDVFPMPPWQAGADVPPSANPGGRVGRGVPDVSGDADPRTGYGIVVDGSAATVGGTSAVAPLWTGLLALINQGIGKRVGYVNPLLYRSPSAFTDVVKGNNGAYKAGPGWDACTGWGSPIGDRLLAALG